MSGADRNRLYAIIEAEGRRHLHVGRRRRDVEAVNEDRRIRQRAFYYTRIYADPKAKDTVYVLNTGVYRIDRRRQDAAAHRACRTATTTTCGSRRTTRSG